MSEKTTAAEGLGNAPQSVAGQTRPTTATHQNTANAPATHPSELEKETKPSTNHPTGSVNVSRAEADFAELNRELSKSSREKNKHASSDKTEYDEEKQVGSSKEDASNEEPFDLQAILQGNKSEDEASGIKSKKVGVVWDDLTVRGIGGVKNYVKTFPQAFVSFFNVFETAASILGIRKKGREFDILHDFRGVVKPGEMVLVLGRPGSGCTTFLKVISNQRYGYTGIDGEVRYGPFDAQFFGKRYRGEAVYNGEDDIHHPTLTVGQTLEFALDMKIPGKRPAGMSRHAFKEKVVTLMLNMFNISHTRNTIVGDPVVRGISGGERKRVSIAEMMVSNAAICSWDNTTRGLDAATAVDWARSVRILTDVYKLSTFVSLYQASETVYEQFDKVLVIDEGRQVYFGPAQEARAYFEGLGFLERPRQTTPDYLTGCTDEYERDYKAGRDATNAPHSPETLAKAFKESKHYTSLVDEMADARKRVGEDKHVYDEFQQAVKESKRHTSARDVYTIPFHLQVWGLFKRQFLLKWQDKFSLTVSWIQSIVVAIIVGTVWLNLPTTSDGAFTRGGVLFIALLFNAFTAFGELAGAMIGRPLVNKHRSYAFHRPSALWIAQIAVDLLFSAVQILVFSIMVYFMTHLARDAGAFFVFYLLIVVGYLSMTLFFRTVGCLCPDFDVALRLAAVIIMLFVFTSGYLIQWDAQQVWLRWIFYINALGLAFSSMMVNEFKRIDLTCTGGSLVPFGPGYTDLNHQSCTLPGSTAGSAQVAGRDYLEAAFQYSLEDQWRNFGIIIGLIVAFLIANAILGEYVKWGAGGRTVTYFVKEDKNRKQLNEELMASKLKRKQKENTNQGSNVKIASKSVLTWEALNYDVPVGSGQLRLLKDIYGYVKPGSLTALMGASGAGKTTLLDVLAARKNIGVITGDVLVDAIAPGIAFQRGTSYAEQLDLHEPAQTVREALRFSATLRQPYDVPLEEKWAYVEEVISLLEMEDIADAIIGEPDSGLAVEQRKRVTIGVELAAKPALLLFLDEPTSGLDSQSAFNIVRFLRKLAAAGQAILCTIHQPNSALFENFDRLLLLQRGGQTVYFGDIGKDAVVLREYFAKYGAHCPDDANPAEWMLDAIGAGISARIGDKDWGDIWNDSEEFAATKAEILDLKAARRSSVGEAGEADQQEYATPLWHQVKTVTIRQSLSFWRTPNYGFTRWFVHAIIALIAGFVYFRLDSSRSSLQQRIFIVFQTTFLPAIVLASVEPKYAIQRIIAFREQTAKAYSNFPFALSMIIAEVPYSILCAVTFFLPLYYLTNFQTASSRAGYQFFIILITEFFSVSLGQMLAALTPNAFIASLLNPFIVITFSLFCGVTVPKPQIPGFWRAWLYYLNPLTYLIEGMVVTELHDRTVVCTPQEFNTFTAPSGTDCGTYMEGYFSKGGLGYLADNATSTCNYCAYKIGDQFYEPLGYSFSHRWRDLGILAGFVGSSIIILLIAATKLNFNRR